MKAISNVENRNKMEDLLGFEFNKINLTSLSKSGIFILNNKIYKITKKYRKTEKLLYYIMTVKTNYRK
jgi:hypothetical protein